MRIASITVALCLSVFCSCGEQNGPVEPEECQFADEGWFSMRSLDIGFTVDEGFSDIDFFGGCQEFKAILVAVPSNGNSEYLVLRDEEGVDYRFEVSSGMEKQLASFQIGKTYIFKFWVSPLLGSRNIYGIMIFDEGSLLYLAVSYMEFLNPPFSDDPFGDRMKGDAFKGTELEGLTYERIEESPCHPREEKRGTTYTWISLVTNLPVVFHYGEQSLTLYQSQEGIITASSGDFLVHVLRSVKVDPQNYVDGGEGYSFYVKRL